MKPKCPVCGQIGKAINSDPIYRCRNGHLFDDDPNEGGTHSDRNPALRMEHEERRTQRKR